MRPSRRWIRRYYDYWSPRLHRTMKMVRAEWARMRKVQLLRDG